MSCNVTTRRRWLGWLCVVALTTVAAMSWRTVARADAPPRVNVILWFDTEDFLLPADDDAAKRLAEMLDRRGIRATFKVVGEKARVLDRRGRTDVIAALKKHEIGYHSNLHSVHPTPTEYLADCGLLDGTDEFVRREKGGADDVRRIFSVPTLVCYGQPGSSWAPQAIAALPRCGVSVDGVPCYLDSGNHVGFGGVPFWYAGALNVYNMRPNETRMELFADGALDKAEHEFADIADRLANEGSGLVSIFYHPCEWVHESFWDGENFRRGANPPREQWHPPKQRPPEQTDAAFERFGAYVDYIHGYRGVHFVTARDLPALYPDALAREGADAHGVLALARRMKALDYKGVDVQTYDGKIFSPADQFTLLTFAVADLIEGKEQFPLKPIPGMLGPDAEPPSSIHRDPIPWPAFRDAVLDVRDFLRTQKRIPSRVFIGPDPVPPADFLRALGIAYTQHQELGSLPDAVTLGEGTELLTASHVAKDSPKLFGDWIIHRAGFRAPKVMEVARLQAWTLKPAVIRAPQNSGG